MKTTKHTKYRFSKTSQSRLYTCDKKLQILALATINFVDCTVVCGRRNKLEQTTAYNIKNSKLQWPLSNHNVADEEGNEIEGLSKAMDLAPFVHGVGIAWDTKSCSCFAGRVLSLSEMLGIGIMWGGDWDMDDDLTNQNFNDLIHFELID